jgi:heme o synthase
MTPPSEVIVAPLVRRRRRVVADLVALTKPRVVLMILVTTVVGYYVGLAGAPDYARLIHLLVGTALAAGGTLALNMYWERDIDGLMERTRLRPLPDGRLAPLEALLFGSAVTLAGLVYLAAFVNIASAAVTTATFALYLFAYTPLKLRTPLCTLVGAVPGALPPVTGWVAAREELGLGAWVLFAILFLWQLPHFLALSWIYRDEYARAGLQMLSVGDSDGRATFRQAALHAAALVPVSLAPAVAGLGGPVYFLGAALLSGGYLWASVAAARHPSREAARRLFFASLIYLPSVLAVMIADRIA